MHDTDRLSRPVNLWYPCPSKARSSSAGQLSCERYSDPEKARARAEELIRCGKVLGSVQIEDVETGALLERVTRPQ